MPIPLSTRIAAMIPTVTGWCSIEKGNDLALAVLKSKSSVSVEVGVFAGRSCIPLAMAHREQNHGIVIAIDPWSSAESIVGQGAADTEWWGTKVDHEIIYQGFLASLKAHDLEKWVEVIRAPSDSVTPPKQIDVFHCDGNHSEQSVRDVERFGSLVGPSGFLFLDDLGWSNLGPKHAADKLPSMGFTKLFDRDTGAMFQRQPAKTASAKKRGRPPGSKNKKRKKKS